MVAFEYHLASAAMKSLLLACLAIALATGCEDEKVGPRVPAPLTDPQPQPNAQAAADNRVIEKIAAATCDREQSCGTIGPSAYFPTREECLRTVREKNQKTLNPSQCPNGIEQKAVDACLASLDANQCAQPGDSIDRAARCPPKDLCIK
jgi:hypothetical protein